jgi:hypothetical protein
MNNVAFPLEKELLNYTMLPFGWVSMTSVENRRKPRPNLPNPRGVGQGKMGEALDKAPPF